MATIKQIQAKNFKSFVKPLNLPFGNKFNIFIGPNGSGKSNLVDLVCFVLGKSSAKQLRAKKSANLIYHGGKKGKPAKEAQASITFTNDNKEFPIDTKEVKITRKIKQSGNSAYYINDEKRTRQQTLDILRKARIDPNGHNITLQGDIVHFMEMKTEERRELIEEIAGISVYEEKKAQSLNELEKVETRLSEANIILTEREAYLRELKKERDQAKRYKEIQRTIKSNKATYLHLQIKDKESRLDEINSKIKKRQNSINKIKENIENTRSLIRTKQEQSNNINKEIEEKGEVEQIELQKSIEELRTNLLKKENRLEICQSELNRIKQRKLNLENDKKELKNKISSLEKNKENLEKNQEFLSKKENNIQKQISKFKEKHGIKDLPNKIETIDNQILTLEQDISDIQEKKHELLRTHDQLQIKIDNLNQKIQENKSQQDSHKKEAKTLETLRQEFKKLTLELSKAQNEELALTSQLNKTRANIQVNNEELAKLRGRNLSIQESLSSDLATKKILNLNDKGIYGLVSDLGNVDSKYSLALEVAAGARIKNIVVDNDLTASKCIKILKENKLGIATFLPLNKLKERKPIPRLEQLKNLSGVIGPAIDLVKFDKKFKKVFSYVLGSTLIVNDLQTARQIGIGRTRMVTIDGSLIEISGAMVGGFRRRSKGLGFQEKQLNSNITQIEKEVSRLKLIADNIDKRKLELENNIYNLKDQKSNTEGDILKIEKTLGITPEVKDITEEKQILSKELSEIKKSLTNNTKELKTKKLELEKTKESKQELNKQITAIKTPELSEELNDLDSKKQNTKERIIQINSELKNIDIQINSIHLPEKNKISQILKQHSNELTEFEEEITQLTEKIKNQKSNLKQREQKEKLFHKNYKNLFTKRNKLAEEIRRAENQIISEDDRLDSIQEKLNNTSITKAKHTAELEGLQTEFEEFKGAKLRIKTSIETLKKEIREAESDLTKIGSVNLRALDIYEQVNKEYSKILEKTEKLRLEKADVLEMMNEIESKKKETFMKTFRVINKNFKEIFSSLSTKGEASLDLENQEEPFEAGVDIRVKLIGNKFMDIKSLSGGEKTLAALSFIFAIQDLDPAPFYLLDEVDAALDKHNSELLSKLIAKYADKAQYLVISHNDALISEANLLYGVSMQNGISKVVSLKI